MVMAKRKAKPRGPDLSGESEAVRFFYAHAGWGYTPGVETPELGRLRGARALATAEAWAASHTVELRWIEDQHPDRSGIRHKAPLWACLMTFSVGDGVMHPESLWGIDLGASPSLSDPYCRVVQAELALEAMPG
jgi:hypothetical protein